MLEIHYAKETGRQNFPLWESEKLAVFCLLWCQQLAEASSIYTERTETITKIGTDSKEKLDLLQLSGLWYFKTSL